MKQNKQYAHRSTISDIENFYDIMSGKKKIFTKKDVEEFEASYFAMCLLIPREYFLKFVEVFGGLEKVKLNYNDKTALARLFNVEEKLIEIRIDDLLSQEKEESEIKKLSKK